MTNKAHDSEYDPERVSSAERGTTVGIVGLGLLGKGIATCLLGHGLRVVGLARRSATHREAANYIEQGIEELIEHADFDPALRETWRARCTPTDDYKSLSECGFVIESVAEDFSVKQSVFDRIESEIGPDVPIASNTSALPISRLQQSRRHPERFLGMHWAQPVHAARFLEIIRGEQTSDAVMDFAEQLGRLVGKSPSIVRKDVPGFIVNRLGYAVHREAMHLVELGVADIETIDRAYRNAVGMWSTLCGPFRWMDLNGGPAMYAQGMSSVLGDLCTSPEVPGLAQRLAEENARGIVNGRGFYQYTEEESAEWRRRLHERVWQVRDMLTDAPESPEVQT